MTFVPRNIPRNIEAEESILGSILLDGLSACKRALEVIVPADFYAHETRLIFEVMASLAETGRPIDTLIVADALRSKPSMRHAEQTLLDDIGTEMKLVQLLDRAVSAANIGYYCEIVREKAMRRLGMERAKEVYFSLRNDEDGIQRIAGGNGQYNLSQIVSKGMTTPKVSFFQVGQYLDMIGPPPPMLVDGLIPENSLILCTGKPKHGKSFLALDIAHRIVLNTDVFETYRVNNAGPVIYFSMEDSKYTLANRLLKRGIRPDSKIPLYVSSERFNVGTNAGVHILRDSISGITPRLVIVDTAAVSLGVKDWSNRAEVEEKLTPIREFAREVCSVLLVAHNRKAQGENGDEIAGTNALTGAVDGWLSSSKMEVQANGNLRVFYSIEGRDIRGELCVEMDTHTLHFTAISKEELAETDKLEEEERRKQEEMLEYRKVADALRWFEGKATATQIQLRVDMSKATFYRLQKRMMAAGHLRETGQFLQPEGGGKPAALLALCEGSELVSFTSFSKETKVNETNSSAKNEPLPPHLEKFFDAPRTPYKEDDDDAFTA